MESDKEEFHQFLDSTLYDNIRKCLTWKGEELCMFIMYSY
jgi:hypothetical protein